MSALTKRAVNDSSEKSANKKSKKNVADIRSFLDSGSRASAEPVMARPQKPEDEEKKAKAFNIGVTGVHSGDYIQGIGKQNKDTLIEVRFENNKFFPPSKKAINSAGEHWKFLVRDLLNWGFYENMSFDERLEYIEDNSTVEEFYLSDIEIPCEIKFIDLGANTEFSVGNKISEENRQRLISGEFIPIREVYDMFPKGTGRRSTLIFRPDIWKLINPDENIEYKGYLNLITNEYSQKLDRIPEGMKVFAAPLVYDGKKNYLGVLDFPAPQNKDLSQFIDKKVESLIKWFTPAVHKSLIQKCIRVRPEFVSLFPDENEKVPVDIVFTTSFCMLLMHPGSFVPDLNTFVIGSESALKRLAVALMEDSTTNREAVQCLFASALAARGGRYFPSIAFVERCIQWGIDGILSKNMMKYQRTVPVNFSNFEKSDKRACIMMDTLKAFKGDIIMIHDIYKNDFEEIDYDNSQPEIMPIYHCLDQHSITEIAYFFTGAENDLKKIIAIIWTEGTGINSRRSSFHVNPYVKDSQRRLWIAKCPAEKVARPITNEVFQTERNLDKSWIAGLTGPMPVKITSLVAAKNEEGNPIYLPLLDKDRKPMFDEDGVPLYVEEEVEIIDEYGNPVLDETGKRKKEKQKKPKFVNQINHLLAFYHPENIDKVVSIRKPSRDADIVIDDELKIKAAREVIEERRKNPWKLKSSTLDIDFNVFYRDGDFDCVTSNGDEFKWSEFCNSSFKLPIMQSYSDEELSNFDDIVNLAYRSSSKGIVKYALDIINIELEKHSREFLLRLGMYLRSVRTEFEMLKLSKDGSSTYLLTDNNDGKIFRFFLLLCALLPAVIETGNNLRFKVKNYPYWNIVRELVFEKIRKGVYENEEIYKWNVVPSLAQNRELRPYQTIAINNILDRIGRGRKANLIWMDAGLGKTQIILSIIESLIRSNTMPEYAVFSITPSSIKNIETEVKLNGLEFNWIDPRKTVGTRNLDIKRNCINLIRHDHMDDMRDALKSIASRAFFLFDEVHEMFGDSKRTSVALEVAKVCDTFVGMTGTLIKNKDISKDNIIEWLSQVVDFEITPENFMIGVATLTSGKTDLNIVVNRSTPSVAIPSNSKYFSLVDPDFGGTAAQTNYAAAAMTCFEILEGAMVRRVLDLLEQNKQNNNFCVFLVALNAKMQSRMFDELTKEGKRCFAVSSKESIKITSKSNPNKYQVVITTTRLNTGYDVTAATYMITAPYPTNEATRTQLVGRIVRLSQEAKEVFVETFHCGILSYTLNHHEVARRIASSLSGLQKKEKVGNN
jgi:superfamily II DNA or RNA helicase